MSRASRPIDLNADLGERIGDDAAMLEVVTSANIACGAHAGDVATMQRTCALAAERGVVIGAHPGYPDRVRFGRVDLEMTAEDLEASLTEQLAALQAAATGAGATIRYVKPHGALYHRASVDLEVAAVVVRTAAALGAGTDLLVPPGSAIVGEHMKLSGAGHVYVEGFADRAYVVRVDGGADLMPRDQPGAVLSSDDAVRQAVMLATTGMATAPDGTLLSVHPRSICVHGDTPGAVALARAIRAELALADVTVQAFAG